MDDTITPIQQAINAAGGITKLARALGVASHAVVHNWRRTQVPADRCPDIEALTGVRCEDLRPDVKWGVLRKAPKRAKRTPTPSEAETTKG